MADGWFVIAPFGEPTGSGLSGTIPPGSQLYHATGTIYDQLNSDFTSNNATPVIIGGKKWEAVMGPFATKADAQSAVPPSWWQALGQATGLPVGGPLSGLAGIAGGITAFYHAVTDGKLWRSLGWLLLGIVLMLAGVLLWIGPSAARQSPIGIAANAGRRLAT